MIEIRITMPSFVIIVYKSSGRTAKMIKKTANDRIFMNRILYKALALKI